jgi:hypothetical protein
MGGWQQMNSDDLPSHIILSKIILDNTCYFFPFGWIKSIYFYIPKEGSPLLGFVCSTSNVILQK